MVEPVSLNLSGGGFLRRGPDGGAIGVVGGGAEPILVPSESMELSGGEVRWSGAPGELPMPVAVGGTRIFWTNGNAIKLREVGGGGARVIVEFASRPMAMAATEGGDLLAVVTADELAVVDGSGEMRWRGRNSLPVPEMMGEWILEWGGDGAWCAVAAATSEPSRLGLIDLEGGELREREMPGGVGPLVSDGSTLWVVDQAGGVVELNAPSLESGRKFLVETGASPPSGLPRRAVISPDGREMMLGTFGGHLTRLDLDSGESTQVGENGPVAHLQFATDGGSCLVLNDLGIGRIYRLGLGDGREFFLEREFRIFPDAAGMGLLWAGALADDLMVTVDRFEGVRGWDWQGRELATRGPRSSGDPEAGIIAAAGGSGGWAWTVMIRPDGVVTRVARVLPESEDLTGLARELTGREMTIGGEVVPAE